MKSKFLPILLILGLSLVFWGCPAEKAALSIDPAEKTSFSLDYDKYVLENGLEVILHQDNSDPIVAVSSLYHVGSNREKPGKTGFAHLFEHMMFQASQHVGQDQFFRKIQGAGGTLNGGTWNDGTIYYQIVPKNALEMVLWMESDRMGYLLSTVTQEAFANQQEVVMNEKRQRVDNQPYGHTNYVIGKLLYPEGHPYNWQTIGSLEDLRNSSLQDVHDFFRHWYRPNNTTLVIAGDFDREQVDAWVKKYFGEIQAGDAVPDPAAQPVTLEQTKRYYHEDNFANSPELNLVFPTIAQNHPDTYALNFLSQLLSNGKKAPLYKVLVEEKKLAPSVSGYLDAQEIASEFRIRVRAFPNTSLTDVENAVFEAFARFEEDGFTDQDVARIKASTETDFYNGISSVLNKAFQLTIYNEFYGSPDYITQDLKNIQSVTADDIRRVYNTYIKDKPYVMTSFVPREQVELVAENSSLFELVEESMESMNQGVALADDVPTVEPLPTSFDRTVEPGKGPDPELTLPSIWQHNYANGLKVYGIEQNELPLVNFNITVHGGLLLDDPEKVGVANLMSDIMMEGTRTKTPLELEEAIDDLGSSISMYTSREAVVLTANTLTSNFKATLALAQEILLDPRWDEKEFERIKQETVENIMRQNVRPSTVAGNVFNKLIYGPNHILSNSTYGTPESVAEITIDDLKKFHQDNFSPSVTYISIAGNISHDQAVADFQGLETSWPDKMVKFPEYATPAKPVQSQLYFVDFPDARQSEIRIGYPALAVTDEDYYPANVMNYKLGGSFNGNVNLILREEKGFTYGARTGFRGTKNVGPFTAYAGVQANATAESVTIFKDEMEKYLELISDDDLTFTKQALIKSNARRFETLGALIGMLNNIAAYDLPFDYVKTREQVVRDMTQEKHNALANKYITPDQMIYLVVGDAATQLDTLNTLGLGQAVLLDKSGSRLDL